MLARALKQPRTHAHTCSSIGTTNGGQRGPLLPGSADKGHKTVSPKHFTRMTNENKK